MTVRLMHPNSRQEVEALPGSEHRYIANGWRPVEPDAPEGNASLEDWQEYARSKGFSEDEIEGMSRDELRATFG